MELLVNRCDRKGKTSEYAMRYVAQLLVYLANNE